ncbi:peptidylprolyl isomerase [Geomonas anaerohicana]|uniref:peptidylprolyl isomerase n=1 Tax=Geomonas anaerohicana TaxID=2798583 RepID=A0ABS0YFN1_9BACT|nr:peptidylprolyl isomerase [Geomonas anaerohicana]MBJ6751072.1 peptidylprolyl isomerase [Geomonas anaerohicana]
MFSFKKSSVPAVAALLMALTLPAAALAEEAAGSAAAEPAAKTAPKPAKKAHKKHVKKGAKPAAKAKAKTAAKATAPAAKPAAKTAAQEPVKEAAKEPVKEAAKAPAQEAAKEPVKEATKAPAKDQGKDPLKEATELAKEQQQREQSQQSQHPANIAVLHVNNSVITKLDMDRALKVMLAQSQVKQPLAPDAQKEAEAAVLEQLTSVELLYQEAVKLEVPDLDKQVTDKVAQNRAKFKTDQEFIDALKSVDMTMQDMQDFTRKDIVINNFIEQKFTAKAAATDAEAKKFYEDNKNQYFMQPEGVRASHILVSVDEKATPEERKRAKEKAEALLKRVKAGEDFAAVAKAESSCPSASQGGDLGAFGRGEMVPAFEKAAFALKTGEVSGVVESEFGYHIIKVTDKQEAGAEKFDNVKDKIADFLKRQKVQQEVTSLVEQLKKTAKIQKD